MRFRRKPVCYRINRGECQQGYQALDCGTPNEVYATLTGGTPIAGAVVTPCGDCPAEVVVVAERGTTTSGDDVELVDQAVCSDGVNYVRTTFFKTSDQSVLATVWQDAAGAVVAPPVGVVTLGACPVVNPVKVAWLRLEDFVWRGEGAQPMPTVTGASLTALLGPLLSVTIKQMRGQGLVTGAARPTGAVAVDAGETWSWSSHGSDQEDTLDPDFALYSNGGLMRVIVTYRAP